MWFKPWIGFSQKVILGETHSWICKCPWFRFLETEGNQLFICSSPLTHLLCKRNDHLRFPDSLDPHVHLSLPSLHPPYPTRCHRKILTRFPGGTSGKDSTCQCKRPKRRRFHPWVRKIPWRREWLPMSVFLPGESCGWRSLVGYSP